MREREAAREREDLGCVPSVTKLPMKVYRVLTDRVQVQFGDFLRYKCIIEIAKVSMDTGT